MRWLLAVRWALVLAALAVIELRGQTAPSIADQMRASVEKQRAAMAVQREAARKQAEKMGTRLPVGIDLPPPVAAIAEIPEAPCEPVPEMILAPIVDRAARAQKLDSKLLRAVIGQESAFRPCAVSAKGAQGLMQLMPETAGELGLSDPFDPAANVEAGAKYLGKLLDRYHGDLFRTLGAYNAGPTAVDQAPAETGGIPEIPETLDYVTAIFQKLSLK